MPFNPDRAIKDGRGAHTTSLFLLIKIHTDKGITGLGEVSCTPGWSDEDQVTAAHFIRTLLAPPLIGERPTETQRLAARIQRGVATDPPTRSGLEMAV